MDVSEVVVRLERYSLYTEDGFGPKIRALQTKPGCLCNVNYRFPYFHGTEYVVFFS
jgi:hypothetical protein